MPTDFFSRNLQGLLCKYSLLVTCNYIKEVLIMQEMTLREVCIMVGVTRRAVQCYEQEGLVRATGKNKYGYLLYDEMAVQRIKDIKMYQDFGFKLKDIKVLFGAPKEEYVELMTERLIATQKQLVEIETSIAKMKELISDKQK